MPARWHFHDVDLAIKKWQKSKSCIFMDLPFTCSFSWHNTMNSGHFFGFCVSKSCTILCVKSCTLPLCWFAVKKLYNFVCWKVVQFLWICHYVHLALDTFLFLCVKKFFNFVCQKDILHYEWFNLWLIIIWLYSLKLVLSLILVGIFP